MNHYKIDIQSHDKSEVIICRKKMPYFIIAFMSIFCLAGLILPFIIMSLSDGENNGGILFSSLFFWGVGIFLLRIILWNSFGRQVIIFEKGKVSHHFNYGLFKSKITEVEKQQYHFSSVIQQDEDEGRIVMHLADNNIVSPFNLQREELNYLLEQLSNFSLA
jgi:hypothetical protein